MVANDTGKLEPRAIDYRLFGRCRANYAAIEIANFLQAKNGLNNGTEVESRRSRTRTFKLVTFLLYLIRLNEIQIRTHAVRAVSIPEKNNMV